MKRAPQTGSTVSHSRSHPSVQEIVIYTGKVTEYRVVMVTDLRNIFNDLTLIKLFVDDDVSVF